MWPEIIEIGAVLGALVFLEGVLAADNALVLAVLVSRLTDKAEQKKALLYGIFGALFFRGVSVIAVTWLISLWYFKAAGAAYLLFITIHYFATGGHKEESAISGGTEKSKKIAKFWPTVILVELTDIAFSVDQIVAAVSLTDRLWLIYAGGMMGLVMMRYAATVFVRIIEVRPLLAYTGHILPAWIGLKLAAKTLSDDPFNLAVSMPPWLFWGVMVALVAWGVLGKKLPRKDDGDSLASDEKSAVA